MNGAEPENCRDAGSSGSNGELAKVYASVENYYSRKIETFGPTPPGVDWRSYADQELRFSQLVAVCDFSRPFSLNDLGCGYAALWPYLTNRYPAADVDYLGVDLSPAMIARAEKLWPPRWGRRGYCVGHASPRVADYSVASGVFNVKLDQPAARWERFVASTLVGLYATSRCGFAVNLKGREPSRRQPPKELYETPPEPWIAFCERELGASVELRTGYGLREFTLLVRPRSAD